MPGDAIPARSPPMSPAARARERARGLARRAPAPYRGAARIRAGRLRRPGPHAEAKDLDPRERALATAARLRHRPAAGTLDHSRRALEPRPPERLDAAGARRAAARPVPAAVPGRDRRPCRRQRERRAGQAPTPRRRRTWSTPCCAARRARAPAARWRRFTIDTAAGGRDPALGPGVAGRAVVGRARRRATPARCCAAINRPAESALRVNTLVGDPATRCRRELPVAAGPRPGIPEGLVLEARSTPTRSAAVRAGRDHAAVARLDARRAGARPRSRRAGARPVRRARGQDDPSGGADGRSRASSSPSSAIRAGRRRCERTLAADAGRAAPRCGWPTPGAAARLAARFDRVLVDPPCSGLGTLQSRPDLRWRVSPEGSPSWRPAGADPRAPARPPPRRAGRSCTRSARSRRAERQTTSSMRFLGGAPRFRDADWPATRRTRCRRTVTAPTASSSPACAGRCTGR